METCLICQKGFENKRCLGIHVKKRHDILAIDYKRKFGILPLCKKCGKELSKRGKLTGFCNICRDRTGENNSFFGRVHSKETVNKIKEKGKTASIQLWKNQIYRKKVIENATGLKRTSSFKKTQKENANKQFEDPEQRKIRSEMMKKRWRDGLIKKVNESGIERDFFNEIKKISPYYVEKTSLDLGGRTIIPDMIIGGNIVIEFNGDFWHGNPRIYDENDMLSDGISAKEKWEQDKERTKILEDNGFRVHVIWEMDYKKNKQEVIKKIDLMLNWDEYFLS